MFNHMSELYDEFIVSYNVFMETINEENADRFLDAAMLLAQLSPYNPFRESKDFDLNGATKPGVERVVVTAVAE